jgi:hypothetical protein
MVRASVRPSIPYIMKGAVTRSADGIGGHGCRSSRMASSSTLRPASLSTCLAQFRLGEEGSGHPMHARCHSTSIQVILRSRGSSRSQLRLSVSSRAMTQSVPDRSRPRWPAGPAISFQLQRRLCCGPDTQRRLNSAPAALLPRGEASKWLVGGADAAAPTCQKIALGSHPTQRSMGVDAPGSAGIGGCQASHGTEPIVISS